ncbi:MAG: type II toxin-antitoxin system PemK/MazF family toxin [Nitrospirota bacterium]
MNRGEIWWADQPQPIGRRPVVLLSRNEAYHVRNAVTVAQITTTIRDIPIEIILSEKDGLPQKCVINADNITTIPKSLLLKKICPLPFEKLSQLNKAIKFALDLD